MLSSRLRVVRRWRPSPCVLSIERCGEPKRASPLSSRWGKDAHGQPVAIFLGGPKLERCYDGAQYAARRLRGAGDAGILRPGLDAWLRLALRADSNALRFDAIALFC